MEGQRTGHRRRTLRGRAGSVAGTVVLVSAVLVSVAPPVGAAAFTVDRTDMADTVDVAPGDGVCADVDDLCSLRAAVMEANALGGTHSIHIERGESDPPAIPLGILDAGGDSDAHGDVDVTADITITVGPRAEVDVVPGFGFDDRAFHVRTGGSLELVGVNVRSFTDSGSDGGAILNEGTLVLGCGVHVENSVGVDGGGVHNAGVLRLEGTAAIRGNTGVLGGNLYAAAGSSTTLSEDPSCVATLQLGDGSAERGGAIHAAAGSEVLLLWDFDAVDNSATVAGGVFSVVDDAELRFATGRARVVRATAPTGSVAHVTGGASLVINPGPPEHSVEVRVVSASVAPGGAHFHAEAGELDLTDVDLVDSTGTAVLTGGSSVLEALRIVLRRGGPDDDGIVLGGATVARVQNSYVEDRSVAVRVAGTSSVELIHDTLVGNDVALDHAPGTTVDLVASWLFGGTTMCVREVESLLSSAVEDTSCGAGPGSVTDPSVASGTRSYAGRDADVWGPADDSPVLALVPMPCPRPDDLLLVSRPGGNGACEPGAVEWVGAGGGGGGGGTAHISGTLVADGTLEPVPDTCVIVVDVDHEPVGEADVAADGTWTVGPVPDGDHRLVFYPCHPDGELDETSPYVPEAWRDRPVDPDSDEFAAAGDPVTVAGVSITGIDACIGTDPDGGDRTCGVATGGPGPAPSPSAPDAPGDPAPSGTTPVRNPAAPVPAAPSFTG